jgi:flagellar FliJ protein
VTFTFRLQRLLSLREEAEQAQARALAGREAEAAGARDVRDTLAARHAEADAQARQAAAGARVGHLQQFGVVVHALETRVDVADDAVAAAEQAVAEARATLEEKARDRQVLDRLKARHAEAWRAEEARRDRELMDDIALARHARKTTPGGKGAAPAASPRPDSPPA